MPVHIGKDSTGCFAQWGTSGKKYRYTCGNATARNRAKAKAAKQDAAAHASGFTGNTLSKDNSMPTGLQKVIANLAGVTRNDTMAGKSYLVAPAIMVVEGVLNGSEGALLYPANELKKSVPLWNSKPAVLYHPKKNGEGVSACDPIVLSNRGLGVMMNTSFEDNKLKTEVWLDMERVKEIDERVLDAVENNEVMELSTGLLVDTEKVDGEFNGVSYEGIARNYRPDHLAILPDLVGACSIEDGAGFLRLNQAGDSLVLSLNTITEEQKALIKRTKERFLRVTSNRILSFLDNEMSDEDRRQLLQSLLKDKFPDEDYGPWIDSIFSDEEFFIYEKDGKLFKQEFGETDDIIKLIGFPVVVTKQVNFIPVVNRKGNNMPKKSKKKIVNELIENESNQWTEENRQWLMTQETDILDNITPVVNEEDVATLSAAKKIVEEAKMKAAENKNKANQDVSVANTKPKTVDEYLKDMPPEMQGMIRNGIASHEAEKKRLINTIMANEKNRYTEEMLQNKELSELQILATLAAGVETSESPHSPLENYGGQGEVGGTSTEEALPLPTLNFSK